MLHRLIGVLYFTSALRVVTRLPPGWARVTGHIMQVISGMRELGLASLGLDHLYIHCDSQHHVSACEHFFLPFVPALNQFRDEYAWRTSERGLCVVWCDIVHYGSSAGPL